MMIKLWVGVVAGALALVGFLEVHNTFVAESMAPSAQLHRKLAGPMSFLSKSSWSPFTSATGASGSLLASSRGTAGSEAAAEELEAESAPPARETPLAEDSEYDSHLSSEFEESEGLLGDSLEEEWEALNEHQAVAAEPVDRPAIVRWLPTHVEVHHDIHAEWYWGMDSSHPFNRHPDTDVLEDRAAASSLELLSAHRQRRETHPERRKLTGVMLAGRQDLPSLRRAVGACNHSIDATTFDSVWVIVPDPELELFRDALAATPLWQPVARSAVLPAAEDADPDVLEQELLLAVAAFVNTDHMLTMAPDMLCARPLRSWKEQCIVYSPEHNAGQAQTSVEQLHDSAAARDALQFSTAEALQLNMNVTALDYIMAPPPNIHSMKVMRFGLAEFFEQRNQQDWLHYLRTAGASNTGASVIYQLAAEAMGMWHQQHTPYWLVHSEGDHDKLNGDSPPCALMQQLSDTNVPGMIQELRDGHLLQLPAFLGLDGNEGNHPQLHELQQHIATAAQTDQS